MNALATFQRAPNIILNKYSWKFYLGYLEDIIIFFKENDQDIRDIENVLSTLYAAGVSFELRKCHLVTARIEYLGHTITLHRLKITKAHTKDLKDVKQLGTLAKLCSFLGMSNLYRRFFPDYSRIAASLNSLLKKGQPPTIPPLDDEQTLGSRTPIVAILSLSVLSFPRPGLPYSVETDAYDRQLGAALFQS